MKKVTRLDHARGLREAGLPLNTPVTVRKFTSDTSLAYRGAERALRVIDQFYADHDGTTITPEQFAEFKQLFEDLKGATAILLARAAQCDGEGEQGQDEARYLRTYCEEALRERVESIQQMLDEVAEAEAKS